jgi:hypothetical protein
MSGLGVGLVFGRKPPNYLALDHLANVSELDLKDPKTADNRLYGIQSGIEIRNPNSYLLCPFFGDIDQSIALGFSHGHATRFQRFKLLLESGLLREVFARELDCDWNLNRSPVVAPRTAFVKLYRALGEPENVGRCLLRQSQALPPSSEFR